MFEGMYSSLGGLRLHIVISWGKILANTQRKDGVYPEKGPNIIYFLEHLINS